MEIVRGRIAERKRVVAEALAQPLADRERLEALGVEEPDVLPAERPRRERAERAQVGGRVVADRGEGSFHGGRRRGQGGDLEHRQVAERRSGAEGAQEFEHLAEVHGLDFDGSEVTRLDDEHVRMNATCDPAARRAFAASVAWQRFAFRQLETVDRLSERDGRCAFAHACRTGK